MLQVIHLSFGNSINMKISDLINKLNEEKSVNGDIEVAVLNDKGGYEHVCLHFDNEKNILAIY